MTTVSQPLTTLKKLWYPLELNRFAEPNIRLDLLYSSVVMVIHCSEISWARGSSPAMLLMLAGRKRTVETSRSLRWSRTSGCGYYKEHIIPAFRRIAPFPRDFPFSIHSHLAINAVQFTILSIIAVGYRSVVAPYGSELSSILLPISKTATIDKTLFYGITGFRTAERLVF